MNKLRIATLVLLCFCAYISAQAQDPLKVKEVRLSNGMNVMLNEDHSQPIVFGAVVVKAGGKDCPDTGIAHYFEHIMFKGTDRIGTIDYAKEKVWLDSISMKYDELAQTSDQNKRLEIQKKINQLSKEAARYAIPNEFNRLTSLYGGSDLNAYTTQDETVFHNSFSPQYIEQWCWLNSERMLNPVFRLFQGELETVYEEKNRAADNMMIGAMQYMYEYLFKDRPYAYPVLGSTENLKNPKQSDMNEFFKKFYVGSNMGLVLCGDIDIATIMPLLEKTFGRIPMGEKPQKIESPMPDIAGNPTVEVRIPLPVVSAEALVWKGVTDEHPDKPALRMAMMLLSNGRAGMLDSLANENKLMAAGILPFDLNDAGAIASIIVPNILGSKNKAEAMVMQQIERLKKGDFDDEMLEDIKMELLKSTHTALERIDNRSQLMIDAMSKGITWQQMLDQLAKINSVSKDDVVRVASRYLNDNFVRFVKKYGTYPKDNLQQPGYEPVIPQNTDKESDYAKELKKIPVNHKEMKIVDFDKDAYSKKLAEHSTLYTVKNEMNELFEVNITLYRGSRREPRLDLAVDYIQRLGTDSLTKQQLEAALQRLGSSMDISCSGNSVSFKLSGWDKNFDKTMRLFAHFIDCVKPDKKVMAEIKKAEKADRKSFEEDNSSVFSAVLSKVMNGSKSPYLIQPSVAEIKKMNETELIDVFKKIFKSEMTVVYSGTLSNSQVENTIRQTLPIDMAMENPDENYRQFMQYSEPIVYIYNLPKARQTLLGTYDLLPPSPEKKDRMTQSIWAYYMGSGMSSILFQEIREFRSMAYSTYGSFVANSRLLYPQANTSFITMTGTQADKSMKALATLDSLMLNMPMRQQSFEVAKQSLKNEINNSYPSFRGIGGYIASNKVYGINENALKGYDDIITNMKFDDIKRFHDSCINGKQRVYILVGKVKQMDLKKLAEYGKIVMLKKADVYR